MKYTFWNYLKQNHIWLLIIVDLIFFLFWLFGALHPDYAQQAIEEAPYVFGALGFVNLIWVIGSIIAFIKL